MDDVMNNKDLRRLIFSYLRKYPKKRCHVCGLICVRDKEVNQYVDLMFSYPDNNTYCMKCYERNFRCNIS